METLQALRAAMQARDSSIAAIIIPSSDAHMSEYLAASDQQLRFVSRFTGSAGTAVVTREHAALWTDSRYFIQAEKELPKGWTLMRQGEPSTPSITKWLKQTLPESSSVACDGTVFAWPLFKKYKEDLEKASITLAHHVGIVDEIWTSRPALPHEPIWVYEHAYAGALWADKVTHLRTNIASRKFSGVVIDALDDIAWLFNLRGSDIVYNPVFMSFCVVRSNDVILFVNDSRFSKGVSEHLEGVTVRPYDSFWSELPTLFPSSGPERTRVLLSKNASYRLKSSLAACETVLETSLVAKAKAVKNSTELEQMRSVHVRDGVAVCEYLVWLEHELAIGHMHSEYDAAMKLEGFRRAQLGFVSLSFTTISSVGPDGAIVHYSPPKAGSAHITLDQMYLCDSGGQYLGGTTDITRTVHFGTPSAHEKKCFTGVLRGHIGLSRAKFPTGTKGRTLDGFARAPLWELGLNYGHGTGHGVGACLNVHEGPMGISSSPRADEHALEVGHIVTIEPGYYEAGNFGIRIENVVEVVEADSPGFLAFKNVTVVPIQKKLIDQALLTDADIEWLNAYHELVRQTTGEELKRQGKDDVHAWLMEQTSPLYRM